MSTKIYTGFISKRPIKSPYVLLKASKAISEELRPMSTRLYRRATALFITSLVDQRGAGLGDMTKPLYDQFREHMDNVEKQLKEGRRYPQWDTEVTWTFFPRRDGRVMGIMYVDNRDMENHWDKVRGRLGWEDYAYWNNSDAPKGMTEAQFRKRGKEWDRVLAHGIPSMDGLTMDLWGKYAGPSIWDGIDTALPYQPSFKKRLAHVVTSCVDRVYYSQNHIDVKGADWGGIIKQMENCGKWRESEEGKKLAADELARLMPLLPKRIKKDHLIPPIVNGPAQPNP